MIKHYQEFNFVVEDMPPETANKLLDIIVSFVESHGLTLGGGFNPTTDSDYETQPEANNE